MFVMGTGVCGVWGRDGFGVLGPRGVNGLADGLSTCGFFTTGVVPLAPPAAATVPVATVVELFVALGAAGVDLSDPAPAITPVVGVLAMPVGVVVLLLGAGDTSGLGVTSCCGCCCCTTGMGCGGGCSIRTGEVITTGEVCGGGIVW